MNEEMEELYVRANIKLSRIYFRGGKELWPQYDVVVDANMDGYWRINDVWNEVESGKATVEDFKAAIKVWFYHLTAGWKQVRKAA